MTTRTGRAESLDLVTVLEASSATRTSKVRIGTGRTHQIRVHLSSLRHPVSGDTLYGAAKGPMDPFCLPIACVLVPTCQRIRVRCSTTEAPLPPGWQGGYGRYRDNRLNWSEFNLVNE